MNCKIVTIDWQKAINKESDKNNILTCKKCKMYSCELLKIINKKS